MSEALFRDAMARLVSGVAVVTSRHPDGRPCGLLATSVSSFSAAPPSVLISVGHVSRCHAALVERPEFGVHLLQAGQRELAELFASRADDKFAAIEFDWDGDVPQIRGALAYLRCHRTALFELYDHSILVGDVAGGAVFEGEPLVYRGRRMDWRLTPP